ncbi:MAG: putative Ig domain-containing protein [Anaerolineales bacterium]
MIVRTSPRLWLPGLLLAAALLACRGGQRPDLVFSPAELPQAQVGRAYSVAITISENATPVGGMSVESGALPAGLELKFDETSRTAQISGTPTESGTFKFTASAWCFATNVSSQNGQKEYELVVK